MMRPLCSLIAALMIAGCTPDTSPSPEKTVGDETYDVPITVFTARKIYTGVPESPVAGAIVVGRDGRILDVLPEDFSGEIGASASDVEIVNVPDAYLYPGFVDSHIHLLGIGQRELLLDLTGTESVADLVAAIAAEASSAVPGQVIYGRGWIETGWPEGRMPVAADLDTVAPDNPVILVRADGHALVANSSALAAAGVSAETVAPKGGAIERDEMGGPTGILIDNAMAPLMALVSKPSDADLVTAYVLGAQEYVSRGWTGGHNMSVDPAHAPLLARLDAEDRMPLRLYNAFDIGGFDIAAERQFETRTITNRAVKLYMDGALGSRGAQLIEPYSDRPGMTGLSLMDRVELANWFDRAKANNVQLAIHAIGDLANRRVISMAQAREYSPDLRWRIEHTQILHPDDIGHLAEVGLIASMQPSHAIGDLKFAPDRLGLARLRGAYAWRSLIEAGAVVTGGSDAPVEVGSPLIEFYAAVARRDLEGNAGEGWHPEEALSREQALALFTTAPAYASFMEDDLGTLEIGKIADITGFDRDIMTVEEADILKAKPVLTVVDGVVVN